MYIEIIKELKKDTPQTKKIQKILIQGKPLYAIIFEGFSHALDLADTNDEGDNFFHLLAKKQILSNILPTVLKYKDQIEKREGEGILIYDMLNSVNNEGLTPAHISVENNPIALNWLAKFGVSLTTKDYTGNILKVSENAEPHSPLEYIFQKQERAQSFFSKIIRARDTEIWELFKEESINQDSPGFQDKFKEYFVYIKNESIKSDPAITLNSFISLFKHYWSDILDTSEFLLPKMLLEVLNGKKYDFEDSCPEVLQKPEFLTSKLLLEMLSGRDKDQNIQLKKSEQEQYNEIITRANFKDYILEKCAIGYLGDSLNKLKIEDILNINTHEDIHLTENSPNNLVSDMSEATTLLELNERSEDVEADKTLPSQDLINPIKQFSIQDFAQDFLKEIERKGLKTLKKEFGEDYSPIQAFTYFSNQADRVNKIFQKTKSSYEKENDAVIPLENLDAFFTNYIEILQADSFLEFNDQEPKNVSPRYQGVPPYTIACERGNDQVAKLLLAKGNALGLCVKKSDQLTSLAIKYGRQDTIKYLISDLKLEVSIYNFLTTTIKNAKTELAEEYVKFNIQKTNLNDDTGSSIENSVFKYALSSLRNLLKTLADDSINQDDDKNTLEHTLEYKLYSEKLAAAKKLTKICKVIKILDEAKKLDYKSDNQDLITKTGRLLKSINKYVKNAEENLSTILLSAKKVLNINCKTELADCLIAVKNTRELIFANYPYDQLNEEQQQRFNILKSGLYEYDDSKSTCSGYSILSDLDQRSLGVTEASYSNSLHDEPNSL